MGEDSGWGDRPVRRSVMLAWLALGILLLMGSLLWFIFYHHYHHFVPGGDVPAARLAAHSGPGGNPEVPPPFTDGVVPVAETEKGGEGSGNDSTGQHRQAPKDGAEKPVENRDAASEAKPGDGVQNRGTKQAEHAVAENTGGKANHSVQGEAAPEQTKTSASASGQPPEGNHGASVPRQTPAKGLPAAGSGQKQQEAPKSGKPDAVPAVGAPARKQWSVAQLPAVVKRLPVDESVVYLTFDDGPTRYLEQIVQVLVEKQVPATFFWIGGYAPPSSQLIKLMQQSKMLFGTHTVSHQKLTGKPYQVQKKEIGQGTAILARWTGSKIHYVRPPYGARDNNTDRVANELGLKTILWSIDPRDWEKGVTSAQIIQRVISQLHPGAVILLHEKPMTLQALPQLIDQIREAGYQLAGLPVE